MPSHEEDEGGCALLRVVGQQGREGGLMCLEVRGQRGGRGISRRANPRYLRVLELHEGGYNEWGKVGGQVGHQKGGQRVGQRGGQMKEG